jgi:hypothetical protein
VIVYLPSKPVSQLDVRVKAAVAPAANAGGATATVAPTTSPAAAVIRSVRKGPRPGVGGLASVGGLANSLIARPLAKI